MIPVRQSTAFETAIGPVLDADGVAVTGGVVGDFKIKKTTGNFAALNGSATLTHVSAGFYDLVLTTSDTDTVGLACIAIDDTTNCCAPLYLQVVEEAVYDGIFAASAGALATAAALTVVDDFLDTEVAAIKTKTDFLPSATAGASGGLFIAGTNAATTITTALTTTFTGNVTGSVGSIASGGITAASLDSTIHDRLGIRGYGTAQSASGTAVVVAAGTGSLYHAGQILSVKGSTQGYWQDRVIVSVSTDTLTVDALDVTPSGTITYVVFAAAPASATALPAVNVTQFGGAAGTFASGRPEVNTTHVGGTSQTAGNLTTLITTVDTVVDSILVDTAEIGAAGAGLTALASQASVNTIDDFLDSEVAAILAAVDTEVAAIKTKTDSLTFTQAGHVDANIQRINDVAITGDGSGTPFGV